MKRILTLSAILLVSLITAYGASSDTPRPEYPRPQFERAEWINLNGTWSYTFDFSKSGAEKNFQNSQMIKL